MASTPYVSPVYRTQRIIRAGIPQTIRTIDKQATSAKQMEATANYKTAQRESEIRGILDKIIGFYEPGGAFGEGYKAELEATKKSDVASKTQQLISSGMYGTTTAANLPQQWESTVGASARLKLEDLRYSKLASALQQKASFVESIENMLPDYSLLGQLTSM